MSTSTSDITQHVTDNKSYNALTYSQPNQRPSLAQWHTPPSPEPGSLRKVEPPFDSSLGDSSGVDQGASRRT
ncbi:hypothetical protein BP5796_04528 [Coleophoma crateriformis]|uniref:Uncharacterized protein n=1 Tax=Coleophoma crateriformis TaxID=565419 RepID=A0A3D8S9K8_9HELO|nr:hypothetical protein BP5796_04528 [Coleophoma crateriformis]